MAEVLFVLVTIYAVYVIQSVLCKDNKKPEPVNSKPETAAVAETSVKNEAQKVEPKAAPPVTKKPAASKAKTKTKTKAKTSLPSGSVKNPETGEIAKIPANYRMTKRWIKEALVTEGLLDKIYKTNEIDDAAKEKINKALVKLQKMDKYQ